MRNPNKKNRNFLYLKRKKKRGKLSKSEKVCWAKKSYRNRISALAFAQNSKWKGMQDPYNCPHCKMWHLKTKKRAWK